MQIVKKHTPQTSKTGQKTDPAGRLYLVEQKNQALRRAADAHFYPTITAHSKAQVFAAVRAWATQRSNVAQQRQLLAERAQLIPTFHVFRALVLEDLRAAYDEDRRNQTRAAKNRRLSWMSLYKHFAALRGIDQALLIQAVDRSGNYRCERIDKTPTSTPNQWRKFVELAAAYGISETELSALYQQARHDKQQN